MSSVEPTPEGLKAAEEMAAKLAGLRIAHEAVMLEDAQDLLKLNRESVRAHQQAMATGTTPAAGGEDVIHVGDVIQMVQPTTEASVAVAPAAAPTSTWKSTVGKVATAAALVAGGAGAGTLIPWALGLYGRPATTAAPGPDRDTQYELRFGASNAQTGRVSAPPSH